MLPIPIKDNVLVRRFPRETIRNGITIPEKYQKMSVEGIVAALGKGCQYGLKEGDRVTIGHVITTDVLLDNKEYAIVSEKDIFFVIEENEQKNDGND